jgi:hypothetical protein
MFVNTRRSDDSVAGSKNAMAAQSEVATIASVATANRD